MKYRIKHGDLMPCCLATLDNYMSDLRDVSPHEGDVIKCREHDGRGMIFLNGGWEQNVPSLHHTNH